MTKTKNKVALAGICAALALPAIGLAGNAGDGSDYGTSPDSRRPPRTHRAQDMGRSAPGARTTTLPEARMVSRPGSTTPACAVTRRAARQTRQARRSHARRGAQSYAVPESSPASRQRGSLTCRMARHGRLRIIDEHSSPDNPLSDAIETFNLLPAPCGSSGAQLGREWNADAAHVRGRCT